MDVGSGLRAVWDLPRQGGRRNEEDKHREEQLDPGEYGGSFLRAGTTPTVLGLRDIWGWWGAVQAEAQNSGSQGWCFPRSLPPAQGSRCAVPRSCLETVELSSARPFGARARAAQHGSERRGRQATVLRDVDPLVGWQSGEKHRKTRVLS